MILNSEVLVRQCGIFSNHPCLFQVDLKTVKVSWSGLLQNSGCADGMRVKWWRTGGSSSKYEISDKMDRDVTSFIVKDLMKFEEYLFQVGWETKSKLDIKQYVM